MALFRGEQALPVSSFFRVSSAHSCAQDHRPDGREAHPIPSKEKTCSCLVHPRLAGISWGGVEEPAEKPASGCVALRFYETKGRFLQ